MGHSVATADARRVNRKHRAFSEDIADLQPFQTVYSRFDIGDLNVLYTATLFVLAVAANYIPLIPRRHSMRWCSSKTALVCLLLLAGSAPRAAAQVSASISGTVTDTSSAVLAVASVTATDLETTAIRTTVTDAQGRYQ